MKFAISDEMLEEWQVNIGEGSADEVFRDIENILKDRPAWDVIHALEMGEIVDILESAHNRRELGLHNALEEHIPPMHPTLQQAFCRTAVRILKVMAREDYPDARNEASVALGKRIVEMNPGLPLV